MVARASSVGGDAESARREGEGEGEGGGGGAPTLPAFRLEGPVELWVEEGEGRQTRLAMPVSSAGGGGGSVVCV